MNKRILMIKVLPRASNPIRAFGIGVALQSYNKCWRVNSRFYSYCGFLKLNKDFVKSKCTFHSSTSNSKPFGLEDIILGRRVNLYQSSFQIQKRCFSFDESYASAVLTHSTVFKWISECAVVEYAQHIIVQFHDKTGLPWWLSIIFTTLFLRSTTILPLAIYQNYVIARLENVKKEMDGIVNDIKYDLNREVRKRKWSEKEAKIHFRKSVKKEYTRLIERDNCHPAKTAILAIIQIPTWVVLSTAFRNLVYKLPHNDALAQIKYLELSVGGVAWFPDLTVPDSIVIPIVLGLTNLAIIEVQALIHSGKRTKVQIYMTNFLRGFSVFMIPVAASIPSCMTLYWATSSAFGLCQNLLILSPRVRRVLRIPDTPNTLPHPYAHIAEQFKSKFRKY